MLHRGKCDPGDTLCLDVGDRSLLKNLRTGLIDPDTPESAKTKVSADGKEWKLVVSTMTRNILRPSCSNADVLAVLG